MDSDKTARILIDAVDSCDLQTIGLALRERWKIGNNDKIQPFETTKNNLVYWAAYREKPEVLEFLISKKVSLESKDSDGRPVLHHLILHSKPGAATLIKAGADVNIIYTSGLTPLYTAAGEDNCSDIIRLLVEHGAKTEQPDEKFENNALGWAIDLYQTENALTLIELGARAGFIGEVGRPLSEFAQLKSTEDTNKTEESREQWDSLIRQLKILEKKGNPRLEPGNSSPGSLIIGSTANLVSTLNLTPKVGG